MVWFALIFTFKRAIGASWKERVVARGFEALCHQIGMSQSNATTVGEWRLKRLDGKIEGMSVQEIEAAIAQLPRHEISELSRWFEEFQNQMWDEQIERDAKAGRFDQLIEQAKAQYAAGQCKPL